MTGSPAGRRFGVAAALIALSLASADAGPVAQPLSPEDKKLVEEGKRWVVIGNCANAVEAYERVSARGKKGAEWLTAAADAYECAGNFRTAIEYTRALDLLTHHPVVARPELRPLTVKEAGAAAARSAKKIAACRAECDTFLPCVRWSYPARDCSYCTGRADQSGCVGRCQADYDQQESKCDQKRLACWATCNP